MVYKVPNPLPLVLRLRTIAREEGTRAAFDRVTTFGRLRLAQSSVGKAVGFGKGAQSLFAMGPTWVHLAQHGVFFGGNRDGAPRHLAIIAETSLPQCTKYRVMQAATLAEGLGMGVTVADHRDEAEALSALQMASHVMFYRLEPSSRAWMYLYEARRLGLPVLYDLDDPLFSVPAIAGASMPSSEALAQHFADAAPGFLAMMSACDAISVSTSPLAAAVRAFLPRPVFLRRNFADTQSLSVLSEDRPEVPRGAGLTLACASGSQGRDGDLVVLGPVLEQFLSQDSARRLVLIGHGLSGFCAHLPKQVVQVGFQDYPAYMAQLAAADAVLVPLADDPFNACKSAVRAMDAAAIRRPVIASPMGDLADMVQPGKTGWLARDPSQWAAALAELAALPDRGRAMGTAARQELEQRWSDPLLPSMTDAGLLAWLSP